MARQLWSRSLILDDELVNIRVDEILNLEIDELANARIDDTWNMRLDGYMSAGLNGTTNVRQNDEYKATPLLVVWSCHRHRDFASVLLLNAVLHLYSPRLTVRDLALQQLSSQDLLRCLVMRVCRFFRSNNVRVLDQPSFSISLSGYTGPEAASIAASYPIYPILVVFVQSVSGLSRPRKVNVLFTRSEATYAVGVCPSKSPLRLNQHS